MATNKRLIKSNDEGGVVPPSFNTVLYTGDGQFANDSQNVTGVGFQPDFVWVKDRGSGSHFLQDIVRGQYAVPNDFKTLLTNSTADESLTNESWHLQYGGINSLNADGFTAKIGSNVSDSVFNKNGQNYVAWCWKAGGAAVTNTDGTITSQVSANTEAGFSIVSYTGNGANATIGHGLNSAPDMFIVKRRDGPASWAVYHSSVGVNHTLQLNTTSAQISVSGKYSGTNSSVFGVNSASDVNFNNSNYIAYCFAEVAGFSKFGSYVGTGAAGQKQTTGFEPAFVMLKKTSSIGDWIMLDNKRDTTNPNTNRLQANLSDAEEVKAFGLNFLSDGFDFNAGSYNDSGATYIYMAFANQF